MGRLLLTWRLVIGDIKRRRVQSALLLLMIVTTTTTLTLGLALHKVTDSPFARTRAATMGPDIVAEIGPAAGAGHDLTRQFAPLLRAPGVAAVGGPYPVAFARLTTRGINVDARDRGPRRRAGGDRSAAAHRRPVDQPRRRGDRARVRRRARPPRRRRVPA